MKCRLLLSIIFFTVTWWGVNMSGVQAQTGTDILDVLNPSAELAVSPRHPEPGQPVTVSLQDYSFESTGATISWVIDGETTPSLKNQRRITLNGKPIGQRTSVEATLTLPNGQVVTAQNSFRTSRVDFLIEANTLTPTFYAGRALPTAGSQVRVTAIPFTRETSTPSDYSYQWEVSGDLIDGGAVRGKNATVFRSGFETSMPVTVTVYDSNGTIVTSKSTRIRIQDPEIYFYERNPLRGLLPIALRNPQPFIGQEMTVRAEPYYYDTTALGENTHIQWQLNGRSIDNANNDPFTITLQRQTGSASFTVGLELRNLRQLLQAAEADITFRF